MAVERKRYRFTTDEYHAMGRAGILAADTRVELLDGEIVEMPPIGTEHAETVDDFNELFFPRFGDVARVRVQNPIWLNTHNEVQPDVALLRRRPGGYRGKHPGPEDVFLVVEVADTTLADDRARKIPRYAEAVIREVWLVDVPHALLHVYREPTAEGYRVVQTPRRGDRIAPLAFPDRELEVSELLG